MSEHTLTPWAYRPQKHDDWGWIRDADGNLAATARDGRVWSEQFDEYRTAGKDPYEPNAAFIVRAVNNHQDLVDALKECMEALASCYQVTDYPADGTTSQDAALKRAERSLAAAGSRSKT